MVILLLNKMTLKLGCINDAANALLWSALWTKAPALLKTNVHVFKHFLKVSRADSIAFTKCCIIGTQRLRRNTYRLHAKKKRKTYSYRTAIISEKTCFGHDFIIRTSGETKVFKWIMKNSWDSWIWDTEVTFSRSGTHINYLYSGRGQPQFLW